MAPIELVLPLTNYAADCNFRAALCQASAESRSWSWWSLGHTSPCV